MGHWTQVFGCLLEVIYPQRCVLCGSEPHVTCWARRGGTVAGLRPWDDSHLCLDCGDSLQKGLVIGRVKGDGEEELIVLAAAATNPDLVILIGRFKYHGIRGLAWPLAGMMAGPLTAVREVFGQVDALVPVALNRRRRRIRGFNQAEILAHLAARDAEIPVRSDILVRTRNTGQQAKITTSDKRHRNLAGAFQARPPEESTPTEGTQGRRVVLVDDLVTSGCTALAAAQSLRSVGWQVVGILALGLAANVEITGPRVDTWEAGF